MGLGWMENGILDWPSQVRKGIPLGRHGPHGGVEAERKEGPEMSLSR